MKGEVGEIRGQLRELNHALASLTQKFDTLALQAAMNISLPERVADLDRRVSVLEASENKRIGAMSLGGWVLKALPYIVSTGIGAGIMEIIR